MTHSIVAVRRVTHSAPVGDKRKHANVPAETELDALHAYLTKRLL